MKNVELVYDGRTFNVPERMGKAKDDQLKGSALENVAELAGRACYDSLGKGRSTADFHKHIKEVQHFSIYEHCPITIEYYDTTPGILWSLLNRPGLWVRPITTLAGGHHPQTIGLSITYNLRHVLDFSQNRWRLPQGLYERETKLLQNVMQHWGHILAPQVVDPISPKDMSAYGLGSISKLLHVSELDDNNQKWITLSLYGSRAFLAEMSRHGDFTGQSWRSTRYCNEAESDYVLHPLTKAYLNDVEDPTERDRWGECDIDRFVFKARELYQKEFTLLNNWLIAKGMDKRTSTKQARGAARWCLGQALATFGLFSASVEQWKWILQLRGSEGADAEIRGIAIEILEELKKSQYGTEFSNFKIVPHPDADKFSASQKPFDATGFLKIIEYRNGFYSMEAENGTLDTQSETTQSASPATEEKL